MPYRLQKRHIRLRRRSRLRSHPRPHPIRRIIHLIQRSPTQIVMHQRRRKRISRGSGTTVQEVNNLLRQYAQMKKMFKQMGKPSFARRMAGMKLPGM